MSLILSGTDGLSDVDGSAATPAIRGTDANTGMFFPAADTIAFSEGGVESMRIDSAGNVGIGTSSPTSRLDVSGAILASGGNGITATSGFVADRSGSEGFLVLQQSSAGGGQIRSVSAGGLRFTDNGAATEWMRINSSGDVGVGTTSPKSIGNYKFVTTNATTGSGYSTQVNGTEAGNFYANSSATVIQEARSVSMIFETNATERMRITSGGDVLIGTTSSSGKLTVADSSAQGTRVTQFTVPGTSNIFSTFTVSADSSNGAATAVRIGQNTSTSRSINAGGTINASGADYAEYMVKAGNFEIAKGDVCGIDANGKLTNVFSDAISFVVKSTNPSYVGGDLWGANLEGDALESARQTVDRIAFSGQVPVNVLGATAGQYIVPVNNNGAIKGEAVSNPTFEQYQLAVGKVIAIESDGRARIIVKVA